jgi:acetamidase/formamidase
MAVHQFQPTHYHPTIGSHEPVLRIAPGDSVVTTTVDAGGRDAQDAQVTARGNPQTGPFFIEGAEPGDTLVVHIESITPNRERGYTANIVAENVVDPDFVRQLPSQGSTDWQVDLAAGVATPRTKAPRLAGLRLPLAPMIGCFGVAPARGQAISTATSAEHGGNMDYKGFAAGTTVYLPVAVPGALFHLGDVHALQGAGEIVGTGIEISAAVRFTVGLQKGRMIGWPRGEDAAWIFTCGNARPLDQALQHATTEMLRWLMADYGLDATGASLLLGQAVEYEVGNVFDPAYTMVCKISKATLVRLDGARLDT